MKNEILYIGGFKLPDRDAGAIRVRAVADALNAAGYSVRLIGNSYVRPTSLNARASTLQRLSVLALRAVDLFVTSSSYSAQIHSVEWDRIAAVIFYPGTAALLWRLKQSCRAHGVPLIVDCIEWYDGRYEIGGRCGPVALESELRMRWLQIRARNVICISSFLERYYKDRGCNVIRIPPLLGKDSHGSLLCPTAVPDKPANHVSLVYAGVPGRKELFGEIVTAITESRKRSVDVSLAIIGITQSELLSILARDGYEIRDLDGVTCHGRMPHEEALRAVMASDFTVILRRQKRANNAGFPSKLVESLSLGVPVIANATSDIADYLRDGRDGYLLGEPTAACLQEAIARASALTPDERSEMRNQARVRASQCFGYQNYAAGLGLFLSRAKEIG